MSTVSHSSRETRNFYWSAVRLAEHELLVAELFAFAVERGMRTLKMDGMEKIMMGLTDLKMVRQVCIK